MSECGSRLRPKQTILLLPHCLKKNIQNLILSYAQNHEIKIFVANGSSQALAIATEHINDRIIAIACDKELYMCKEILKAQGHDVSHIIGIQLQTTGCKETELNITELFEACLKITQS